MVWFWVIEPQKSVDSGIGKNYSCMVQIHTHSRGVQLAIKRLNKNSCDHDLFDGWEVACQTYHHENLHEV